MEELIKTHVVHCLDLDQDHHATAIVEEGEEELVAQSETATDRAAGHATAVHVARAVPARRGTEAAAVTGIVAREQASLLQCLIH